MSDIIITLDARDAIRDSNALTTALDRLENKAKDVKRAVRKFLLAGQVTLKAKRLATDMKTIQTQINARKLFARVLLRVDRRSLKGLQTQIRTHTGRGADLLREAGMKKTPGGGWFATEKPELTRLQKSEAAYNRIGKKIESILYSQKDMHAPMPPKKVAELDSWNRKLSSASKIIQKLGGDPSGYIPPKRKITQIAEPYDKEFKRSADLQRSLSARGKIAARDIKSLGMSKEYKRIGDSVSRLNAGLLSGTTTQKKFSSELKKAKGGMGALDKSHKKLNKTVRRGRGFFMNFTMALTAVAASMFIWQKVKQVMIKVISYGSKLSDTFMNIQAETGITDAATSGLVKTFEQLSDDTIWGIPEMYDAYKTLRKEGLSADKAIAQTIPTLKIARNADMDLAKAARMAAHDTMGLREQYLKLDEAVSKSAGESWQRLKKSIANVFEGTYMKMEPDIIKALERLGSFIKENKESLIAGLERIASAVMNISEAFAGATASMMLWLGKTADITEGAGLKKQYNVLAGSLDMLMNLKKKAKDAPAIFFHLFPEEAEKRREKRIANLDKDIKTVITKMKDFAKKMQEIAKPEIETGMVYTEEDRLKGYQELYNKTGKMSARFFQQRGEEIVQFHDKQQAMWKEVGDTGAQTLATLAASIDAYNLKWQDQAAYMKQNAEIFKFTGKMSNEYYDKLIEKVKDSIILYDELSFKEKANLIFLKTRAEFNKRQAAKAKPHEEVFEETGVMTGWLKEEKLRKALSDFTTKQIQMEETGGYLADIMKNYQMKVLKINTDFYAKRLENQATHFEATGKATNEFIELQIGEYQRAASAMMVQGMDPKAVKAQYDEMIKNFIKDLIAPMLGEWQKYYDATKKMSEQHTAINRIQLSFQYEHMKDVLKNEEAAYEWLIEKANEAAVKRLESEETLTAGMQAAWYRLYEESETLSKMISDAWVQGAHDVEAAWKETFFDAINVEWDNFEQHAIDVLTAIRDTLNEILYSMFKDWAKAKFGDTFNKIIGFDRDKEAQKTLRQTAALEAQNIVLGKQAGMIAVLTAEYWALAMAMAACGMGGGGAGVEGGSGLGSLTAFQSQGAAFQYGGLIDELILGIGQRTGKRYSFGEHGTKELVIPENQIKSVQSSPQTQSITISVPVSVESNTQLGEKIRTEVESLIYDIMQEEMR